MVEFCYFLGVFFLARMNTPKVTVAIDGRIIQAGNSGVTGVSAGLTVGDVEDVG